MSKQHQRKLEALRAMASQDASPEERDIARRKLRELEAKIAATPTEVSAWQRAQMEEEARAQAQLISDETERANLLKRWERGTFSGMTIRAGAVTKLVVKGD